MTASELDSLNGHQVMATSLIFNKLTVPRCAKLLHLGTFLLSYGAPGDQLSGIMHCLLEEKLVYEMAE